ncbi:MAG: neutral ceramidase, partial [Pirellulaceae bacterium]
FVPYPSTHIHDELHVRCLVLDDGKTKLAIVVCDLLGIHRIVSDEARRQIELQHNIPAANVMICATHTHSASSAMGEDRLKFEQTLNEYETFVARRIADGVTRALNELRPAEIAFGTVDVPEHVFNRRWFMRPGTIPANPFGGDDLVKMNPPSGSDNLVRPAGPTDPTVSFISIREPNGKPISVVTSYSLHYVGGVGQGNVSADYFAVYCNRLTRLLSAGDQQPAFVPMMANGTSGDINNISFQKPRPRKERYEQMRYVGEDVAEKVHGAMKNLKYDSTVSLSAQYKELTVAYRRPDKEMLSWAAETLAKGPQGNRNLSYIYAERVTSLAKYPKDAKVPLQLLRIGDTAIGTMPCEVFCEIGMEFKGRCPAKNAFLVSLTHGYMGYLPTPKHHELGGYETWLGTNRLEKTASVKMLDELLKMAGDSK